MMNIFSDLRALVIHELEAMVKGGQLPAACDMQRVTVEPPRDLAHGDVATNAALVLKSADRKPHDIATDLGKRLQEDSRITTAEVAGPGFLNLRLELRYWQQSIPQVIKSGEEFGRSDIGRGRCVNIEFVSANPTGPLHVGHTRGAVFGDALANLLAFAGYEVTREYYINDGGAQVDTLARSVYLRYLEALGREVIFGDDSYPGDYLVAIGNKLADEKGEIWLDRPEEEWLAALREYSTDAMMTLIREDLATLGVEMDVYFSEKSLYDSGRIEASVEDLASKDLIYQGQLTPPKGKVPEDWEPRIQTLFRSTSHGDDVDRPLKKSDGNWTYFAPDIAYHFDKISRGYDILIDVFGADHSGYVKRMKAAVSALSDGTATFDIKLIQLVRLLKNGEPFKMSKRSGSFVSLRDLIERVGRDVTRFVMLTRKNDATLDFDFDKVLEQSRDNPVFYVQYAYARIMSVLRRARRLGLRIDDDALIDIDLVPLSHAAELAVIKKLAEWPRVVEIAAQNYEPHKIAFFLFELAGEFHRLWNRGHDEPQLRIIQESNVTESLARIALARAVSIEIAAGLGILGVTPMQEMR